MPSAKNLTLKPDEFAFYFDTESGVEVDALANFLKRAATLARRHGGELRVLGLREGSLTVRIRAIQKSKIAQNAKKEFVDRPIDTTVKVSPFVVAIVYAIVQAMSPEQSGDTPIAKAAVGVVENHPIKEISIITNDNRIIVMDHQIAKTIRQAQSEKSPPVANAVRAPTLQVDDVLEQIAASAKHGELMGQFVLVDGTPYFRPDGFHYLVPVNSAESHRVTKIDSDGRYMVFGRIVTVDGLPDSLIIYSATKLGGGSSLLRIDGF
ncbi:hypothetical protein [Parasphingorhabdus sp.]|uniref:hypothetical protein n=1 Tax=Parasphingorhabdus sp. TaxID=2709688 RepID=UPI0030025F73